MEKSYDLVKGQIVRSIAGRDKGKFMIVFDLDDEYVYLCDGNIRKSDSLKKKKFKHIAKTNHIVESVKDKLNSGVKVTNAEVRKKISETLEINL